MNSPIWEEVRAPQNAHDQPDLLATVVRETEISSGLSPRIPVARPDGRCFSGLPFPGSSRSPRRVDSCVCNDATNGCYWSPELYLFSVYASSEKDKVGTLLLCNSLLWLGPLSKNVPITWGMLTPNINVIVIHGGALIVCYSLICLERKCASAKREVRCRRSSLR